MDWAGLQPAQAHPQQLAHPTTASVPIIVVLLMLYSGLLLCDFYVLIKVLNNNAVKRVKP